MSKKYYDVRGIIDSIRFYMMLSITCKQNPYFVGDPEDQLNSYLKYIKEELKYKKEKINTYIKAACDTLPSAFVKYYGFETVSHR